MKFLFLISLLSISCSQLEKHLNKPIKESDKLVPIWAKNLDPNYRLGNVAIGWGTPKIEGSRVFVGTQSGEFKVFNLDTGREVESFKENGPIMTKPSVNDGKVYYGTSDGELIVRDVHNLKLIYKKDFDVPLESEIGVSGSVVYLHLRNQALIAFDISSEKVLWRFHRPTSSMTSLNRLSPPTIVNDNLLIGLPNGSLVSLKKDSGEVNWEKKISESNKFQDVDMRPLIVDNRVWIGSLSSATKILNLESGDVLRRIEHRSLTAPVFLNGSVYLFSDKGELIVCNKEGSKINSVKVSDSAITSAAGWGERLIISDVGGNIQTFDAKTLKSSRSFNLGYRKSSVLGHLEKNKNYFVVFSSRNRIYTFKK